MAMYWAPGAQMRFVKAPKLCRGTIASAPSGIGVGVTTLHNCELYIAARSGHRSSSDKSGTSPILHALCCSPEDRYAGVGEFLPISANADSVEYRKHRTLHTFTCR